MWQSFEAFKRSLISTQPPDVQVRLAAAFESLMKDITKYGHWRPLVIRGLLVVNLIASLQYSQPGVAQTVARHRARLLTSSSLHVVLILFIHFIVYFRLSG